MNRDRKEQLLAVVLLTALLCLAQQQTAQPSQQPANVVGMLPSAFSELPREFARELEARGCTIPQPVAVSSLRNVIRGKFASKKHSDWAALCSHNGRSSIVVFWGQRDQPCPSELAGADDALYLQDVGDGQFEFSRFIHPVDRDSILNHYRSYGGPKPPSIDHEGINDVFAGKASVVHYCYKGKWMKLQGTD